MVSIATARPAFAALNTNAPVGYTQVFVAGDYAGTVTLVKRLNADYWSVTVRAARDAFRDPQVTTLTMDRIGLGSKVWKVNPADHRYTKTWVADYWDSATSSDAIMIGDAHDLRAALGLAIDSAARRGHEQGLW